MKLENRRNFPLSVRLNRSHAFQTEGSSHRCTKSVSLLSLTSDYMFEIPFFGPRYERLVHTGTEYLGLQLHTVKASITLEVSSNRTVDVSYVGVQYAFTY